MADFGGGEGCWWRGGSRGILEGKACAGDGETVFAPCPKCELRRRCGVKLIGLVEDALQRMVLTVVFMPGRIDENAAVFPLDADVLPDLRDAFVPMAFMAAEAFDDAVVVGCEARILQEQLRWKVVDAVDEILA